MPHESSATRFGLRPMAYGRRGVVATANPLASLAGVRMLATGGNAVDAIVAAAAAIGVVEPYMSGLAGCGTAMVTPPGGRPRALVFLGVAPSGATSARFRGTPPDGGYDTPAVPGNLAGWTRLLAEYGSKPLAEGLAPAIELAEGGIPVTPFDRLQMEGAPARLSPEAAANYLHGGRVPEEGAILRQPDLAATFRAIATEGAGLLYGGSLGQRLASLMRERGGLITEDDLRAYPERVRWVEPLAATYHGVTVYAPPPPTSAVQVLETLRIVEGLDLGPHLGPRHIAQLAEAVRLARVDTDRYVGDPDRVPSKVGHVLSDAHVADLRAQIGRGGGSGGFADGDSGAGYGSTTHLAAVDGSGLAVNITHSLGSVFGSGVVVPGTGVCLNNAMHWFSMKAGHPNEVAPGKMHEWPIAPVQLHRDGAFWATVGTPGSFGILATTTQVVVNLVDFGLNVQDAVGAPRFRWADDVGAELPATAIMMEARFPEETRQAMAGRGYTVEPLGDWSMRVGGCQAIVRDTASGWLAGAGDPRRNGYAIGW